MTSRDRRRYIESLLEGRRPSRFDADAEDAELIRTAITLQGAREDLAEPRDEFMSGLFEELSAVRQQAGRPVSATRLRTRGALASVAAAAALIGGTFAVTEAVDHGRSAPAAVNGGVHSSALLDSDHRVVGRINLYGGNPNWVFMNVNDPGYDGTVVCQLRAANGNIELTGSFQLTRGEGEWARTMNLNLSRVSSARIVTSTGSTLATAVFS